MSKTKYLDPEFAKRLWEQWGVFSDTTLPILETLNEETTMFLSDGLKGDFSENLITKQRVLFDGVGGFIDHIQMQSYEMKQRLIFAAEEICDLDLLLSQSYKK